LHGSRGRPRERRVGPLNDACRRWMPGRAASLNGGHPVLTVGTTPLRSAERLAGIWPTGPLHAAVWEARARPKATLAAPRRSSTRPPTCATSTVTDARGRPLARLVRVIEYTVPDRGWQRHRRTDRAADHDHRPRPRPSRRTGHRVSTRDGNRKRSRPTQDHPRGPGRSCAPACPTFSTRRSGPTWSARWHLHDRVFAHLHEM
jgi:hypothetical protein